MGVLHRAPSVLLVVTALVVSRPAVAQVVTLPATMTRERPMRPPELSPSWVNRDDCDIDDVLGFRTELSGYQGLRLQAWASSTADCTDIQQRVAAGGGECWPVFSAAPTTNVVDVRIHARVLAGSLGPVGPELEIPTPSFEVCMRRSGHTPLTLYFMLVVDGEYTIVGTPALWNGLGIDLEPPASPTDVVAAPGDGRLSVSWTEPGDTDLFDYGVFCDGPGDDRVCALPTEAGARSPGLCASVFAGASSAVTGPLKNRVEHRVSVVARDVTGNRSDASESACATPVAVARTERTQGGCGCGVSPAPTNHGVALVVAAALLVRRAAGRHLRVARVRSNSKKRNCRSFTSY